MVALMIRQCDAVGVNRRPCSLNYHFIVLFYALYRAVIAMNVKCIANDHDNEFIKDLNHGSN